MRLSEPDIDVVINYAAAILELFQNVDRSIAGRIINDDDLFLVVCLGKKRLKAALDETPAVISHDCDGDEVVTDHAISRYRSDLHNYMDFGALSAPLPYRLQASLNASERPPRARYASQTTLL